MTRQQLLQELIIRFNTNPRFYEKEDYRVLLTLLEKLCEDVPESESEIADTLLLLTNAVSSLPEGDDIKQLLENNNYKAENLTRSLLAKIKDNDATTLYYNKIRINFSNNSCTYDYAGIEFVKVGDVYKKAVVWMRSPTGNTAPSTSSVDTKLYSKHLTDWDFSDESTIKLYKDVELTLESGYKILEGFNTFLATEDSILDISSKLLEEKLGLVKSSIRFVTGNKIKLSDILSGNAYLTFDNTTGVYTSLPIQLYKGDRIEYKATIPIIALYSETSMGYYTLLKRSNTSDPAVYTATSDVQVVLTNVNGYTDGKEYTIYSKNNSIAGRVKDVKNDISSVDTKIGASTDTLTALSLFGKIAKLQSDIDKIKLALNITE